MRPGVLLVAVVLVACRNPANEGAPRDDAPAADGSSPLDAAVSDAPGPDATVDGAVEASSAGLEHDGAAAEAVPLRREDWEVAIGKWTFEPNGEAWCECKATSSLLWWKRDRPKDFDASFEVKFLGPESSAGMLFRSKGEDFYQDAAFYQFEWYSRGTHHDKRLSLMKKNPYWVQIVEPKYPEAPYGQWITMRVRAEGDRIRAFVDGEEVFDQRDATFVRPGKIGIHVFQPRKAHFRNWRLKVLSP